MKYYTILTVSNGVLFLSQPFSSHLTGFGFVIFDNEKTVDSVCEEHFHELDGKLVKSHSAG